MDALFFYEMILKKKYNNYLNINEMVSINFVGFMLVMVNFVGIMLVMVN